MADIVLKPIPQQIIEGFREIPPPTIGHVRQTGFMDTAIRPVYRIGSVVVGRAVTARMARGDVTYTRPAIAALGPGDILVIDQAGDTRLGCWGEMTSLAAKQRGAVGVIIDGTCTDTLEIDEMKMPTFARSISALVGRRLQQEGAINVPVQCGGVVVSPGDLIVADDNGIVVIPPAEAEEVLLAARAAEDRAPYQRRWLLNGGSLDELTGVNAAGIAAKLAERGWE